MQQNHLLKKGLLYGIVVLLVGMSMIPIMSSRPIEKYVSIASSVKETGPGYVNWTVNGTMGDNGWYISPITFTCTYDHDWIAGVYYKYIMSGEWELYTGPFTVYTQGHIEFTWYYVDYQGQVSPPHGPFVFGIDYTPPTIDLTATALNCCHTKWLFVANVSDNTSGINRVEFYFNDKFLGTCFAPGPYIAYWKGCMLLLRLKYLFLYHIPFWATPQCAVYDNAGNYYLSPIPSKIQV
jgi:hypothetical protein